MKDIALVTDPALCAKNRGSFPSDEALLKLFTWR
jgi:hypothetical protein